MQKRSKLFRIGIAVLAACLAATMFLVAGCGKEEAKSSGDVTLKPKDSEPEEKIVLPTEPFYALVVGNDSRADTAASAGGPAYSDTMMLVRIDPVNYQVTLVSIPRDTQTWYNDQKMKINEAYGEAGIGELLNQVEALTGVRPEYYFDMGFADFVSFIDTLGGVNVYVPVDMDFKDVMGGPHIYLTAGEQVLDGPQALVFARVRKIFANDMEACRQMDDRSIVHSLLYYIAGTSDAISKGVGALYDNAETNWDRKQFEALVKDFAAHSDKLNVVSGTGPYDGDIDEETGFWMTYRDEDTWRQIIDVVNNGGSPEEIIALPVQSVE